MRDPKNGPTYALITLVGLLAVIGAVIVIANRDRDDIDHFITFVSIIVPMILGYAFLSRKVDRNKDAIDSVDTNTNGKLSAKFEELHKRFDTLDGTVSNTIDATEDDNGNTGS